jgi:voltage-gated potassium channel
MSEQAAIGIRSVAHRRLMPRRHTTMLCAIVAFFAVRPLIGDGPTASFLFTAALIALMILALLAIQVDELVGEEARLRAERRRNWIVGGILAAIVIGLRVLIAYSPAGNITLVWELFVMAFIGFVTWNELRAVLRQKDITGESISMAISVYLLLGLTWSLLYDVIYQLQPNAFSLNGTASSLVAPGHPIFPVLGYFSFITLTTIGYGDIAPVTLQARYAALVEGVTGQFYLAILVARLVSMQLVKATSLPSPETSAMKSSVPGVGEND